MSIIRLALFYTIMAVIILAAGACAANPPAPGNNEIKPAPIHEVKVSYLKSNPAQVVVYIKGGLSDGCTKYHDAKVTRDGNIVNIKVTVQRPRDAMCTAIYGYFEKTINLGSDFVAGTKYTLQVNDYQTMF